MMFYRNTESIVNSPNGDTNFFDNASGVLQGDVSAPYLFKICQYYVLWTLIDLLKEDGFTRKSQETDDIPRKV